MNVFIRKTGRHLAVSLLTISSARGLEAMERELTHRQETQSALQIELKDTKVTVEPSLLAIVYTLPKVTLGTDGLLLVPLLDEEWVIVVPCLRHLASLSRGIPEDIVIKRLKSYCMRLKGKELALFTQISKSLGIGLFLESAEYAWNHLHMSQQQIVNDNDRVKLQTAEGNAVTLSCRLARVSQTINGAIESAGIHVPLPLPPITAPTWSRLSSLLGKVYRLQKGTRRVHHVTEKILQRVRSLNDTSLIELLFAVNYLNIPTLYSLIENVVLAKKTLKVPIELLLTLPSAMRNRIIMHTLVDTLGPLEGLPKSNSLLLGESHTISIHETNGTLVIATVNKKRLLWQDITNNRQFTLEDPLEHGLGISQVHISQGLLATYHGFELKIWNLETGKLLTSCPSISDTHASATLFCFDKEGRLFSGHQDGIVHAWSTQTGEMLFKLAHPNGMNRWTLYSMCLTEEGYLAIGNSSGELVVWDCTTRKQLVSCRDEGCHEVLEALCDGMDGSLIAGYTDGTIRVWDKTKGTLRNRFTTSHRICSLRNAGNHMVACGSCDGSVAVYDIFTGQSLLVFQKAHKSWPYALCVTQDGRLISAAPSSDGIMHIGDLLPLRALESMTIHQARSIMDYLEKAGKEASWEEIKKIVHAKPEQAVSASTISSFLFKALKSFFE